MLDEIKPGTKTTRTIEYYVRIFWDSCLTEWEILLCKDSLLLPELPDVVLGDTKRSISQQSLCRGPVK
jgi:hypothetical protein